MLFVVRVFVDDAFFRADRKQIYIDNFNNSNLKLEGSINEKLFKDP